MSPDLEKWQSAYLRGRSKHLYSGLAMVQCVLQHNTKTPGDPVLVERDANQGRIEMSDHLVRRGTV